MKFTGKENEKKYCKLNDEERIIERQLLNEHLDQFQISNDVTNEEFEQYQMTRVNNIDKLNEIDNNCKITMTTTNHLKMLI